MGFSWKQFSVPRFYGTDLKSNTIDVKDGESLDNENCFQRLSGVISKRNGSEVMFNKDEASGTVDIDEIGSATLSGTKYYFKFSDGKFHYTTTYSGTLTTISPSPAISTTNPIWWAVLDNKLFFVDGTNVLRYFTGSAVSTSSIYLRPTVALTTASGGTGFDYTYTVDNGLGESPAFATLLSNKGSAGTMSVAGNTGPQTLAVGDKIRIYSHATGIAAASMNVTTQSGSNANGTYGTDEFGGYYQITSTTATYSVTTIAIVDGLVQLYSELGVALNKSAPTGLEGITVHYGRLIGWLDDTVYNSKSSNPHSWPDNASSRGEVWQLGINVGDGESIQTCVSFREALFVMKQTDIVVFGGVGPDDTGGNAYSFRRLEVNKNGCIAGKSARVVGEDEESFLIYLSRKGFFATDGQAPTPIGDKIQPNVLSYSTTDLQSAVAIQHKYEGLYVCALGPTNNRIIWAYDVKPADKDRVGWFKWRAGNIKCMHWDDTRYLFGTYDGWAGAERNSQTVSDFQDVQAEFVADGSFNTATDVITVTIAYSAGDQIKFRSTGTLPTGLTANTTYFVVNPTATTIQVSASSGGSPINMTASGSGTHSLISAQAIDAYYTTNWIKFKSASYVKKLGRLAVLLNSQSSSISLSVMIAYDWQSEFTDEATLTVTSTHLWGDGLWGSFIWGSGAQAAIRNISIPRRKVRSIRYKFANSTISQDLNLLGIEQPYDYLRNRGGFEAGT